MMLKTTAMKAAIKPLALGCLLGVTACSPIMRVHGYAPDVGEVENLIVGGDTKLSIEETIGAPSESGILEENAWYYVNLQTRVTPTESRRVSVLRRLLGNVGSITPPLPDN